MESISLSGKAPFQLDQIKVALSAKWHTEMNSIGGLVVRGLSSRIYIHHDLNGADCFLLVDYRFSDLEFVKAVLAVIANNPDVIINTDFGEELSGSEFVARCRIQGDWDWRK